MSEWLHWTHITSYREERWTAALYDPTTERMITAVVHAIGRMRQSESEGTFTAWINWGTDALPERPTKPLKDRQAAQRWCERRLQRVGVTNQDTKSQETPPMDEVSPRSLAQAQLIAAEAVLAKRQQTVSLVATRDEKGTSDHGGGTSLETALHEYAVAWDARERVLTRCSQIDAESIDWTRHLWSVLEQFRAVIRQRQIDPAAAVVFITGELTVSIDFGPGQPQVTGRDLFDVLGALTALEEDLA